MLGLISRCLAVVAAVILILPAATWRILNLAHCHFHSLLNYVANLRMAALPSRQYPIRLPHTTNMQRFWPSVKFSFSYVVSLTHALWLSLSMVISLYTCGHLRWKQTRWLKICENIYLITRCGYQNEHVCARSLITCRVLHNLHLIPLCFWANRIFSTQFRKIFSCCGCECSPRASK